MLMKILDKLDQLDARMTCLEEKLEQNRKETASLRESVDVLNVRFGIMEKQMQDISVEVTLTNKKLGDLAGNVAVFERNITRSMIRLQDAQETIITVLEHRNILPIAQ